MYNSPLFSPVLQHTTVRLLFGYRQWIKNRNANIAPLVQLVALNKNKDNENNVNNHLMGKLKEFPASYFQTYLYSYNFKNLSLSPMRKSKQDHSMVFKGSKVYCWENSYDFCTFSFIK